jgi:hypothetical protein
MIKAQERINNLSKLLEFVEMAPANESIIAMDCNDHCEDMAVLAEQVAQGVELDEVLPELQEHMKYWGDCREEFIALVNVLKAELRDEMPELPE